MNSGPTYEVANSRSPVLALAKLPPSLRTFSAHFELSRFLSLLWALIMGFCGLALLHFYAGDSDTIYDLLFLSVRLWDQSSLNIIHVFV